MRRVVSILLCVTMLLSTSFVSVYADATENPEEELSDFEYAKGVLAEVIEINRILEPTGLTLEDLRKLPKKDPAFWDEFKELLIAESNDKRGTSSNAVDWYEVFNPKGTYKMSEESKRDADMWGYAWEIAELNKRRDPNAKDIYQETKYMYLSHYVDIPTGPRYVVDPSMSEGRYLCAWITNDDRETYDTYLKFLGMADRIMGISKAAISILDAAALLKGGAALTKLKGARRGFSVYKEYVSFRQLKKGLCENFDQFVEILRAADEPVAFVNRLRRTFKLEGYDQVHKDAIENTFLAVCGLFYESESSLDPLETNLCSFCLYTAKDFWDEIWFKGLIQYHGMRIPKRMWRYWGAYQNGMQ